METALTVLAIVCVVAGLAISRRYDLQHKLFWRSQNISFFLVLAAFFATVLLIAAT